MQKIIEENKGKKADYTIPEGIITGELADNAENRAIAEKNWEELAQIKIKRKEEKLKEKLKGDLFIKMKNKMDYSLFSLKNKKALPVSLLKN